MYWSIIGTFITVFVGTLVSYFTSAKDDTYEAKLLHPLIVKCLNFMPGEPREFKQPPPSPDSINTSRTTLTPETIAVDVQDKLANVHDNLAYETEIGVVVQNDEAKKSLRINNMTWNGVEEERVEVDERAEPMDSNRIPDAFYSPETTGVYRKYELNC